MTRLILLLLALVLLSGCEGLNAALVRQMHKSPGLSRRVSHQILEGLERRKAVPPEREQKRAAPAFMDLG